MMTLPEGYSIRLYQPGDAPALSDITLAAIGRIGLRHYSPEQVKLWAARHPSAERFVQRAADGALIWVALAGPSVPVAYTLLERDAGGEAHLDMLYCHPQHTRLGIAEALLAMAEEAARAEAMPRIYTEASELARPVFERSGYSVSHRRDFVIEHEGQSVPIHNYAMEKPLT